MSVMPDLLMTLVMIVIFIYDVITFPIYFLVYRPWRKTAGYRHVRSRRIDVSSGEITFRGIDRPSKPKDEFLNHPSQIRTLDKAFAFAFEKHASRRCLGTRQIIREEKEKTSDGKVLNKLILGNYSWQSYAEVNARSEYFGKGLRSLGLQQREKLVIYADTRADWLMAAIGCFKFNFPLVTIYTNLGESGVQYGISQTQAEYVLVSQELFPKLCNVLKELPHVKTVIVFPEPHKGEIPSLPEGVDVRVKTFTEVIELGQTSQVSPTPPQPEDIGIIMYTSGSTGNPKGVVLTHHNLVNSLTSLLVVATHAVGKVQTDDIHIAFLPLAHVLELLAESAYIILGVAIGYSSPYTMTDTSLAIKKGQKGDATVLRPTLMCAVPVILDRIYKGINKKIDEGGEFKSKLVHFLVRYRDRWVRRGYDTPIAKALVFKKMQAVVGGRIRMLLSGGAPLSDEAHVFIRTCLCANVHQGYGLTETGAVACVTDERDISTGRVGPPLFGVDIKLVDWEEGGYRVTDTVGPRGEIVIGGQHVAKGYYNMPEQTEQEFYDDNGKRWFKTGDIGQCMPDGTFKIIDRKKDLVKLQMGEYVSLGKVEACLKLHPVVESICVCARSTERTAVALIVPDQVTLQQIGEKLNKTDLSRSALCADQAVNREILKTLTAYGVSVKLERFEIPKAITLIEAPWTPESGMVTAAFKLKRQSIDAFYKPDIDRMYAVINEEFSDKPKQPNKVVPV